MFPIIWSNRHYGTYNTFLFQLKDKQLERIVMKNVDCKLHVTKWWIIEGEAKYYKLFVFDIFFTCAYFCNWDPAKRFGCNQFQKSEKTCKLCENIACTKLKFSIKDLFSKYDQIRRKLRIWSHLLKKSLIENFIFLCNIACQNLYP